MKEMVCNKRRRGRIYVKVLGIVALLLVALSGIASANLIKSDDVSPNHIF
jgi:hypothetical protein